MKICTQYVVIAPASSQENVSENQPIFDDVKAKKDMLKEFTEAQELVKQAFITDQEVALQEFIQTNDLQAWVTVDPPKKMLRFHIDEGPKFSSNEYEMVVKISKKLETILKTDFSTPEMRKAIEERKINGLTEYIDISTLKKPALIGKLKKIASTRNSLIHDNKVDSLINLGMSRKTFIDLFNTSVYQMDAIT